MIIALILDLLAAAWVTILWLTAICIAGAVIAAVVLLISCIVQWAWGRILGAL